MKKILSKDIQLPVIIDNFKCYAPDLAHDNSGFPAYIFDLFAELEEKSFWFRARNEIIVYLFQKYVGIGKDKKVLEIGCGNGYVLSALQNLQYNLIGSDIYIYGLKNAKKRVNDVELIQLDILNIPFNNEFDAIGAFDILEHIDDDIKAMQQVYNALKANGYFLITVPAYQFMWSYFDDFFKHKRRYSQKDIKTKLHMCGFDIKFLSSFLTILFPVVFLSRLLKKRKSIEKVNIDDITQEFRIPTWINNLFYRCMLMDFWFIKKNISLPFGNSILVVAQKI